MKLVYILSILLCEMCFVGPQGAFKDLEEILAGNLPQCADFNKPLDVPKEALKHIAFVIQGPGDIISGRKTRYDYHNIEKLSRDRDMNLRRPTVLYVCGYLIDHPYFPASHIMGQTYRDIGYNYLSLDVGSFNRLTYPMTARHMKSIGRYIGEMIDKLVKAGLSLDTFEVIGISMGGHVMSFIANGYKNITGNNLPVLIGLDPSGPCFRDADLEDRLDPSDADFINVVYTNTDVLGMQTLMGHVNFFANGGRYQPPDIELIDCGFLCSHIRSFFLWTIALKNPDSFLGIKCDSIRQASDRNCYDRRPLVTNSFGHHTDRTRLGVFYLNTSDRYPYFLGRKGLKSEYDFYLRLSSSSSGKVS